MPPNPAKAPLEFVFDPGGPNAYLAWKALPGILDRTGAELVYRPVSLGGVFKLTGNRAPMIRYADSPAKWNYEQLEFKRFIAAHRIPFRMNPGFPINTLILMRVAVACEIESAATLERFVPAVMAAMWEDGRDMGDPAVIAEVLDAAGLDGGGLVARAQEQPAKDRLAANTQAAVDRGVFGVPTFFVGDEMFWGKERLAQVEDALSA
jgi:2-hydroxychromene-2-carboxylate isomerase